MNDVSAAALPQVPPPAPPVCLKDLARHPHTRHTLHNLAYILTEALQVTSAYICDWESKTGLSTVLAEYISPHASPSEQQSDLNHVYNMSEVGPSGGDWLLTGEPIVEHSDTPENRLNTPNHRQQYDAKSVLGIPLHLNNQVVGYAELWESRARREFTPADIQLCQAIITQIGLALENISLLQAQEHQLRLAKVLQAMGALLTTDLTLEEVYKRIFDLLKQVILYEGASIQLKDEQGILIPVAAAGVLDLTLMQQSSHLLTQELIEQRWQNRHAIAIPDTYNDPTWIRIPAFASIGSWAGAALYVKDKFVGVLDMVSGETGHYQQDTAELLSIFANQAATAIENARLFAETHRLAQELSGLHEIGLATSQIMNLNKLIARVYDQIQLLIEPDGFFVALYDQEADELVFYSYKELNSESSVIEDGQRTPVEGLTGWIVRQGQALFFSDLWQSNPPTQPIVTGNPSRCWLGVPLIFREQTIGVISIQSFHPHIFNQTHQRFLQSLANQLAITVENIRLFEAEARRRQEAELLNQLAALLTRSLDLDDLLQQAVNLVAQQLPGVHNVTITLLDQTGSFIQPRVFWTAGPEYLLEPIGEMIPLAETYASKQAIHNRTIVAIEDAHTIPTALPRLQALLANGVNSILYVPILVQDKPVGLLHVNVWGKPRKFRVEEIAFCQGVTYQAANAYEITRLFAAERHQLHLAHTLQQVGALLTTQLSLDEVYVQLFALLQKVVEFDAAAIFLANEQGEMHQAATLGEWPDPPSGDSSPLVLSRPFLATFTSESFLVIHDLYQEKGWQKVIPANMRSWVGALMLVKGEFVGTLNIYHQAKDAYSRIEGEVVSSFANQAAVAIVNTRLHEETKLGANELTVLYQVAQLIVSITDIDELLRRTTEFLAERLYTHLFGFMLFDVEQEVLRIHPSFHGMPGEFRNHVLSLDGSVTGYVVRTGNWYIVDDATQEPLYYPAPPLMKSEIAVPVKVSGEIFGVINVESPEYRAFAERDVRFLTTLAGQIAAAIERILIHHHLADLVSARTVELQQEQERLSALLNGAGEGILFTSPDGQLLYANPAACHLMAVEEQKLQGQNLLHLPHLKMSAAVQETISTAFRKGKRWSGELTIHVPDKPPLDIRLTLSPLYGVDSVVTGFVCMQSDISRLKEVERLKSEFITNVSHELRTPLTNILTSTTLLEKGRPDKRDRYLHVLKAETNRLSHLVNSLLDLSWLEAGEGSLYLQTVNLTKLLITIWENYAYTAQNRRIAWLYQLADDLPEVRADVSQLTLAVRNLLENAFAYTPAGGQVMLSAALIPSQPKPMICLKIQDDGVGIPADELPRVFDRFFRGRASLTLGIPGTGLGLAITRYIIKQHNGWIEIESEEEKGTTVSLWLPPAH